MKTSSLPVLRTRLWVLGLLTPAAVLLLHACGPQATPQAKESQENRRTSAQRDVHLFVSETLVLPPEGSVTPGDETLGDLGGTDGAGGTTVEGSAPVGETPPPDDGVAGDGAPAPDDGVAGDGVPAPDDGIPGDGSPTPDDGVAGDGAPAPDVGEPLPDPVTEPDPATEPDPIPEPEPTRDPTPTTDPDSSGEPEPEPKPEPVPEPIPEPEPTPAPEPDDGSDGDDTADKDACAKQFGLAADRIHIAGQHKSVTISAGSVVYVKVTGNQNEVNLNVEGDDGATIAGLCIFLAGNQPKITVKTTVTIGRIVYIGRGNQSQGTIDVGAGCEVGDVAADLAGNQSSLVVEGDGDFKCSNGKMRGNKPDLRCLKN